MPMSKPGVALVLSAALGGLWWVAEIQNGYADTALATPAAPAAPANSVLAQGEQVARQICSPCHVVGGHQKFRPLLDSGEPSFSEIANRPGTTRKSIQKFITTTHWDGNTIPMTMPDPKLTPEQAVAVSRYIMSLRKQ